MRDFELSLRLLLGLPPQTPAGQEASAGWTQWVEHSQSSHRPPKILAQCQPGNETDRGPMGAETCRDGRRQIPTCIWNLESWMEGCNRFCRVTERHGRAYGSACAGLTCFPEPGEAQDSEQLSCQGWACGLESPAARQTVPAPPAPHDLQSRRWKISPLRKLLRSRLGGRGAGQL